MKKLQWKQIHPSLFVTIDFLTKRCIHIVTVRNGNVLLKGTAQGRIRDTTVRQERLAAVYNAHRSIATDPTPLK